MAIDDEVKLHNAYLEASDKFPKLKDFLLKKVDEGTTGQNLHLITYKGNPDDIETQDQLTFFLQQKGVTIEQVDAKQVTVSAFLKEVLNLEDVLGRKDLGYGIGDPSKTEEYASELLSVGEEMRCSDVYICPNPRTRCSTGVVQMKIDGRLRDIASLTLDQLEKLTSHLEEKIVEKESRKQSKVAIEGSFYNGENSETFYRVSAMQTNSGAAQGSSRKKLDSVVIRILKTEDIEYTLVDLGFNKEDETNIKDLIKEKSGVILVTGKTGTGKSTTVGSLLNEMAEMANYEEKQITFEDPVEYRLRGALPFQVVAKEQEDVGENLLSYYTALKNCLRQAPDVIMIGEARDANTAKYLFDTSQTGHLMVSTMHAKGAVSAMTRLAALGVDGAIMNDSLLGIISQILIRKNCPDCLSTRQMSDDEVKYFFQAPKKGEEDKEYQEFIARKMIPEVAQSTGKHNGNLCPTCEGTGFYGRKPIIELYIHQQDDEEHALAIADICNKDPMGRIKMKEIFKRGEQKPFALNALYMLFDQVTSPGEIMRELPPSYFKDYRSLLIQKTNELIESQLGGD